MSRAMMRVVECRVDGTGESQRVAQRHPLGHPVQQTADAESIENDVKRPTECVVVRYPSHADLFAPVIAVAQQRLDAAIALVLMFTHDQTREKLRQREILAAEFAGMVRQTTLGQMISREQHLPRRFAG